MALSPIRTWIERRRPAPLDVLTPAMQWGRFRTWMNAVLKWKELRQARSQAWKVYETLLTHIKVTEPLRPSDRLARFAHHVLQAAGSTPIRYLEIGAFEGNSTAFVHALRGGNVSITVVDPFEDYPELSGTNMSKVLSTFSANMQAVGADKVLRALQGRAIEHLPNLINAGEKFDIIYIDGSHETSDVMIDALLAWRLLAQGGLMIFDDYWYRRIDLGRSFRPKLAIDGFVGALSHEIEVVDVGRQVFIRKK